MREIVFVAGEVSGDLRAAEVARALRERGDTHKLVGIGGDAMRAAGVELIQHSADLAVMGFVEVLGTVRRHWQLLSALKARFRSGNVAAVALIDYPDFNMLVAGAAKAAGVPVLYYITPQVWAWRKGRLKTLARTVTKAAVILPFEEPLLREQGIDVTFVGHPLLDHVGTLPSREEARAQLGIAPEARVLAMFPGSRRQEIAHHVEGFAGTALELKRRDPSLDVIVAAAPHVTIDPAQWPFRTVSSASFTLLRAADAALCKSGTTTLEASVAGCPFVLAYRTGNLNYQIAKRIVRIQNIGLVNWVAGERLAQEFVQDDLQPMAVADALEPLLDPGTARRAELVAGLARVRDALGQPGAAGRVAALLSAVAG